MSVEKTVLSIKETVERAEQRGMPISEYTLRRAIRSGAIPCRIVEKRYLIYWPNVERYLTCADGADNRRMKSENPTEDHDAIL